MQCLKCCFENEGDSKYCSNCGNRLGAQEPDQVLKSGLEPNNDSTVKNYREISNIWVYSLIGWGVYLLYPFFF